jgi:putative heme degradation protein
MRFDRAPPLAANELSGIVNMKLPQRLQEALSRLANSLDQLEAAGERRAIADRVRADLEDELAVMQDDRARLAVELDGSLARTRALALANDDARLAVERASASVRAVLEAAQREEEA